MHKAPGTVQAHLHCDAGGQDALGSAAAQKRRPSHAPWRAGCTWQRSRTTKIENFTSALHPALRKRTWTATLVGKMSLATAIDHSSSSSGGSGAPAMPVFCFALHARICKHTHAHIHAYTRMPVQPSACALLDAGVCRVLTREHIVAIRFGHDHAHMPGPCACLQAYNALVRPSAHLQARDVCTGSHMRNKPYDHVLLCWDFGRVDHQKRGSPKEACLCLGHGLLCLCVCV